MPRKSTKSKEQALQKLPMPYRIEISKNDIVIDVSEFSDLDSFKNQLRFTKTYLDNDYVWGIKCDDLSKKELLTTDSYNKLLNQI